MGSRISPEDNRVLLILKSQPIADEIAVVDMAEVGPKRNPVNLETESKLALKARPNGESSDVVGPAPVETSNRAAEMAIGYRVLAGGKMKTVIPKRRKLVKTMMYHSIKDFVKSLFRPPPALHNRR